MDKFGMRINKTRGNPMIKKFAKIFTITIAVYILICLAAYLCQGKIIFCRQKLSDEAVSISKQMENHIEDIEITMKDGNKNRGWLVKNNGAGKSNLLIYFGGNAEEVSRQISKANSLQQWSLALINYRGYGMSEGTPGESTMFSDSLEIYDYFLRRDDINKNNISVMGWSLGTGVATYLAGKRNASAVILVSPYDSLVSVAQEKLPILPVSLILRHRFDSIGYATSIKSPLLIIAGTNDKIIPTWHSRKLAGKWGGKVSFNEIAGEDHNSVIKSAGCWKKVNEFLTNQQ